MTFLNREQILNADDRPRKSVDVPEWGGSVLIATLSGTDRDAMEIEVISTNGEDRAQNLQNFRAKLCARVIVDDRGNKIFTDADIQLLGAKSARALSRVYDAAVQLNRIRPDDVEELAGNSASGPSAEPGSDSQAA